tara:strand:+ start:3974 stop:4162 length:189 start_codon:yes stop_codon:yes gene_type:complete
VDGSRGLKMKIGDLVYWKGNRDLWIVISLSKYSVSIWNVKNGNRIGFKNPHRAPLKLFGGVE